MLNSMYLLPVHKQATYSEPSRTSKVELFCKNSQRSLPVNYIRTKAPSYS